MAQDQVLIKNTGRSRIPTANQKNHNDFSSPGSGQKLGEFEGENFCPRAASETPPSCSLEQSRAEKLPYHLSFILCAPIFFLKERQFFCEAVPRERHGGGAERFDFFRN